MPGVSQAIFVAKHLSQSSIEGRSILDVGSRDFNGSLKPLLLNWKPSSYIGVDIEPGPSVDQVVSAVDLERHFGVEKFDLVLCAEMMEHADDWKRAIENMKRVTVPGGLLLLTTRSSGYPVHGFPRDFWRFSIEDMHRIFSDFELLALESDWITPGVFVLARKPRAWSATDLSQIAVFNVLTGCREQNLPSNLESNWHYRRVRLKMRCKNLASQFFLAVGRVVSKVLKI